MPKKEWTEEERKAFGKEMKAAREKKKNEKEIQPTQASSVPPITSMDDPVEQVAPDQTVEDLKRQLDEMNENFALLRSAMVNQNQGNSSNSVGIRGTKLIGETEKYVIDPDNYPDPTPRLAKEPRLAAVNFAYEYELDYRMDVVAYETKTGLNMREPKFHITLYRIKLDDQGAQTDKRYIARRMVFHEDPQAAIVIARENGIPVDETNEKFFLDEMRYLRVRDWLFGFFWPAPADPVAGIQEEAIGGTLVQVVTKSSIEPSSVDFDKLDTKLST